GNESPCLHELLESGPRRRIVFDDQHALLRNSGRVIHSHSHITDAAYLHSSPPPCHFYSGYSLSVIGIPCKPKHRAGDAPHVWPRPCSKRLGQHQEDTCDDSTLAFLSWVSRSRPVIDRPTRRRRRRERALKQRNREVQRLQP